MAAEDPPADGLHEDLTEGEVWWYHHSAWLEQSGYTLRPRYRPGWKPSWTGKHRSRFAFEDGYLMLGVSLLDAVRKSDDAMVMLKRISKAVHPYEAELGRYFSSEPISKDPRNHCFPLYDVIQVPDDDDLIVLVMPFLRRYNSPPFATIGESIEFFRQVFEGLRFMHLHYVAHRDCTTMNVMMEPSAMFPQLFHPAVDRMNREFTKEIKLPTRTRRPTKYYWTDFGLSRRYAADDKTPLEVPIFGGDKSVPEFRENPAIPRNPFRTDVYYLGSMIRNDFLTVRTTFLESICLFLSVVAASVMLQQFFTNFDFMEPLVESMCAKDPAARPTMDEVIERFEALVPTLSSWRLRSRTRRRGDPIEVRAAKDVYHVFRTAAFVVTRRHAIPTPKQPQT